METIIPLLIAAVAALFISLPFYFRSKTENIEPEEGRRRADPTIEKIKALESRKESLLTAIKDIEFDFGLGKLSRQDFEELRDKYKVEAASALREIDTLKHESSEITTDDDLEDEISAERELLLTDYEDEEIEKEILSAREAAWQMNQNDVTCPECGNECEHADLFCSKCGSKIKEEAEDKRATF